MDNPNGVCWTITKESKEHLQYLELDELFYLHNPSEDITTEIEFFGREPNKTDITLWVPFWFEGNLAFGLIATPEDWGRVKEQYKDHFDPSCAKQYNSDFAPRNYISFGLYSEYEGNLTLKQWAEELGMKL